jgi:type I restriction enzyme S subunit
MGEWKKARIEDVAEKVAMGPFGSNIKTENFVDKGVPVIRGGNLTEGRFNPDGFVYLTEKKADELANSNAFPDDIVFTHRGTLGQVGIVPRDAYQRYVISQSQMKLTCNKKVLDPIFAYYFFKSPSGQYALLANTSQTGVPAISRPVTSLKGIEIPLPPLAEQKRIAHILGTLDDKIELNRRMNETLEAMARALFKSWFIDFDPVIDNALCAGNPIPEELQDRAATRADILNGNTPLPKNEPKEQDYHHLFPNEFQQSELGWIPVGWELKRATEIAQITIGKTPPRRQTHWFSQTRNGNIVWVSIRDLGNSGTFIGDSNEYLTPDSVEKFNVKMIPEGTVLLSFKLTIGRVSITQTKMTTNEAIAHFAHPKLGLTKEFIYCYLANFDFSKLGSTSSIATAVNSKIIKAMPFLVPQREVLAGFEKASGEWFRTISSSISHMKDLTKLRDHLLPKLLSGEGHIQNSGRDF